MKNNQVTIKESLYLLYAYVSISTFVLVAISKVTENLGRALNFSPIMSMLIVVNMIVFVAFSFYKRRHNSHINHHHHY